MRETVYRFKRCVLSLDILAGRDMLTKRHFLTSNTHAPPFGKKRSFGVQILSPDLVCGTRTPVALNILSNCGTLGDTIISIIANSASNNVQCAH